VEERKLGMQSRYVIVNQYFEIQNEDPTTLAVQPRTSQHTTLAEQPGTSQHTTLAEQPGTSQHTTLAEHPETIISPSKLSKVRTANWLKDQQKFLGNLII